VYAVTVRDHIMVAHSLPRPVFGPAQGLHGATYVVEATLRCAELDDDEIVVDIGALTSALGEILGELRYRNLDEHPEFQGRITSTEALARWVGDRLAAASVSSRADAVEIVLRESPDAWVGYTRDR
jgi:6-pyruvoyltetrahydropterin/6-carboxytetrahydropterin synthase